MHSVGLAIFFRVVGTLGSEPAICDAPHKLYGSEESVEKRRKINTGAPWCQQQQQQAAQAHTNTRTSVAKIAAATAAPPPPPPRSSLLFSSSLLIVHCPSRPTTIASRLPTSIHTTTTVIQSLTSVSAGSTKTSPSTLQANRIDTRSQAAATAQHRSNLLRIPRRRKHCDKQSTVKDGFNGRVDTSG